MDATHNACIAATVHFSEKSGDVFRQEPGDFVEEVNGLTVFLRGGKGIGRVTRPGLDVAPGFAAINPTPRKMLYANLRRLPLESVRAIRIVLEIKHGAEIARRTLNPKLGIVGGLSVLGTSGLVIPCSHAAYTATIEILIRGVSLVQGRAVVLVTGGRSHRWVRGAWPEIDDLAIVRFGDFIQDSLELCARYTIPEVRVVCMAGKLAKYALGLGNTHAKYHDQSPREIVDLLMDAGFDDVLSLSLKDCRSVRELLASLSAEARMKALNILHQRALDQLQKWVPNAALSIEVLDTNGEASVLWN